MTGNLTNTLQSLLVDSLPGIFGGDTPAVALSISADLLEPDADSSESIAGEPRPDDRTDTFALNIENPAGPYTLTQPPYTGPKRVRLTTETGERIPLQEDEISWDEEDSRVFSLSLKPSRELANITGVEVLYGVTAVFTKIKAEQNIVLLLEAADANKLDEAESLAIAVLELNRQLMIDEGQKLYEDGNYGAQIEIKSLKLLKGESPEEKKRSLTLRAVVEMKATRALHEDEGKPIERIKTLGRPGDSGKKVDIQPDLR